MPKGKGRPFNKPERELAKGKVRTRGIPGIVKGFSVANEGNRHRDNVRSALGRGEKFMVKTGLAPYVRTGTGKQTTVRKKGK